MHEFEEFVDNRLEKLPMRTEEARILTDDVHNIGGNDGLVVLSTLRLTQAEQLLDHNNQETLLVLLMHRTAD